MSTVGVSTIHLVRRVFHITAGKGSSSPKYCVFAGFGSA